MSQWMSEIQENSDLLIGRGSTLRYDKVVRARLCIIYLSMVDYIGEHYGRRHGRQKPLFWESFG
jgi:hypothetical protein